MSWVRWVRRTRRKVPNRAGEAAGANDVVRGERIGDGFRPGRRHRHRHRHRRRGRGGEGKGEGEGEDKGGDVESGRVGDAFSKRESLGDAMIMGGGYHWLLVLVDVGA